MGSIVIFGMGIFVLFALLTYVPTDPSFFSTTHAAAKNACGKVGALMASLGLETFGIGAFLLPAAFGFIAAAIHNKDSRVRLIGTLGGMCVSVMSFTVFLALQWKYWPYSGTMLLTGGAFGAWSSEALVGQFNALGSSIVSLLIFLVSIVLSTPVSVATWGAKVLRVTGAWTWNVSRLVGTYLAYLAGLIAMRFAHSAGDLLQGLIENAMARGSERAAKVRATRGSKREIEVDAEEVEDLGEEEEGDEEEELSAKPSRSKPKLLEAKGSKAVKDAAKEAKVAAVEPYIGPEIAIGAAKGKKPKQLELELKKDEAAAAQSQGPALGAMMNSEAPNVLPELEGKSSHEPVKPGKAPAILPPESPMEAMAAETAASFDKDSAAKAAEAKANEKAAQKLAKTARAKRGNWKLPPMDFLRSAPKVEAAIDREKLLKNSATLKQKFADFGIEGEITAVRPGPVITLYEFKPAPGVRVSRIAALADDLSMALSAQSVRILAPIPGKAVVGIEIPSDVRETVFFKEFLEHPDFFTPKYNLPVVMGKDIGGQPFLSDLAKMPHLLCAGQTGSGKSVFMNGLICSLLYRFTPDELRLILVDPKFIEFRGYQDIPHLLLPVVDDPKNAAVALKWAVREMERRYRILAMMNARNLASFNEKVDQMGADVVRDFLTSEENQPEGLEKMSGGDWIQAFEPDETGAPRIGKLPYIVVIIDELADLMMIAKKEVEVSIARIAQKARAAGIHLVIATQRPSTDVVTGLIKANLPSRASFSLASQIDSRTILDRQGAERLLGQGDMLFIPPGVSNLLRLHGSYLSDDEINQVVSFLKAQGKPVYRDEILEDEDADAEGEGGEDDEMDALFHEAVALVRQSGHASASFLQRHLKVGYNRAARMIETMEQRGIVGPPDGARPREVLMSR